MQIRTAVAAALLAIATTATAQNYIACPDLNPAASASNNTWPMGADTEWRYQYLLPASCFPNTPFSIFDMAMSQHGNWTSSNPGTYSSFQIRMSLTTLATVTTNLVTNLGSTYTTVMNRPSFRWAYQKDTWVDFGLDAPMMHDGASNLLIEIRYTGGNTASLIKHAENPPGGWRVMAKGAGSYNATTATNGPFSTSLPKTRFTITQGFVMRALTPSVSLGNSGAIRGEFATPGATYLMAASLGNTTKIPVGPNCSINLDVGPLFKLSVQGNPLFTNYVGLVAANGTCVGQFFVPNLAPLVGTTIYHAGLTVNPLQCTNTVATAIVP